MGSIVTSKTQALQISPERLGQAEGSRKQDWKQCFYYPCLSCLVLCVLLVLISCLNGILVLLGLSANLWFSLEKGFRICRLS